MEQQHTTAQNGSNTGEDVEEGTPRSRNLERRRTLVKGVQTTFSTASKLAIFLPTGTSLVFGAVLPTIYKDGHCSPLNTTMLHVLLGLCVAFCFLSHFTDSIVVDHSKGKVVYGFVCPCGFFVLSNESVDTKQIPNYNHYKMEFTDVLHAVMSVVVFVAIAFSDYRVVHCLFPDKVKDVQQVMDTLVLIVGFVCSSLFLLFPITRRGFVPPPETHS